MEGLENLRYNERIGNEILRIRYRGGVNLFQYSEVSLPYTNLYMNTDIKDQSTLLLCEKKV